MARADLLLTLVQAANSGNHSLIVKTIEAIAAEERAKNHTILAEQLETELRRNGNGNGVKMDAGAARQSKTYDVVSESTPRRQLTELVFSDLIKDAVAELVQEHHRADLLRSYNLQPRNRILLTGPPGNGKTSLAEALANSLMVPLVNVRYDGLITSYLGETATRLRYLFDFVRTRRCVLFFDEFDTLGKERGDIHETGEIKRVVSSLLLQIDDLPSHAVIVAATNHPELLDRAVWRRFQLRLDLPRPTIAQIEQYFDLMARRMEFSFGCTHRTLAAKMTGASFSELEDFATDVARTYVLSLPGADVKSIVSKKLQLRTLQIRRKPFAVRKSKTRV